ncbi:uncharacterized protein LOC117113771 [Anneissia japonica]|uniref:uncharacterized protein LOC117113771 n=1 Tax=Anneissia japonica TaxID=1529436 RepID=UPI001425AF41|nr:uncharacterized protein LOC117113771 [Anneissia japonica]
MASNKSNVSKRPPSDSPDSLSTSPAKKSKIEEASKRPTSDSSLDSLSTSPAKKSKIELPKRPPSDSLTTSPAKVSKLEDDTAVSSTLKPGNSQESTSDASKLQNGLEDLATDVQTTSEAERVTVPAQPSDATNNGCKSPEQVSTSHHSSPDRPKVDISKRAQSRELSDIMSPVPQPIPVVKNSIRLNLSK